MNTRTALLVAVAAAMVGLAAAILTTPPTSPTPVGPSTAPSLPKTDLPAEIPTEPKSTLEAAPPPRVSVPPAKPVGKMPWERLFDPADPETTPKPAPKKAPTVTDKIIPGE